MGYDVEQGKLMKHDFTKTMRNVYVGDNDDQRTQKRQARDFSITIELDATDKLRYQGFMKQELSFYNSLINAFSARTRTFPSHILELNEQWVRLYGQIAFEGKSIKHLERAPSDAPLIPGLEAFRRYLVGNDAEGNRILTERMLTIMDSASAAGTVHPVVRRNMALEMVRFHKEQASKFIAQPHHGNSEDVYRSAPEMLEPADIIKKRHLQMPRAMVKVEWDEKNECSLIYSAYCANPIKIPNINLTADANWTTLILHQEPNVVARPQSPWVIDVKNTQSQYLLKYLDVPNPRTGQTFAIAKKRSFS